MSNFIHGLQFRCRNFELLLVTLIFNPGISIGVVTAIAAPASIKVEFEGTGGHAGAVLMPYR